MRQRRRKRPKATFEKVLSRDHWEVARALDHKCFFNPGWLSKRDWQWYEPHLILLEGAAVGFAALRLNSNLSLERDRFFPSPGTIYFGRIGIVPLFRGQGLASQFLKWLINWSREGRYSRIACNCAVKNHSSRALLEKFQFRNVGTVVCHPPKPTSKSGLATAPPLHIIVWERPLAAVTIPLTSEAAETNPRTPEGVGTSLPQALSG